MMKTLLKVSALGLTLLVGGSSFADPPHVLSRVNTHQRKKLAYICRLPTTHEEITAKISMNLDSYFMEVELAEGTIIKGFASSTHHPETGITSFFLQGGTEPQAQKLLLSIRNEGEWAEFRRAYGAYAFVCR